MTAETSSNGLPMPRIDRTSPVIVGSPNSKEIGGDDENLCDKRKLQRMHYSDGTRLASVMPAVCKELTTMLIARGIYTACKMH